MLETKATSPRLQFWLCKKGKPIYLDYFPLGISCGFPSPGDDFKENRISLDEELIKDAEATFFARVDGNSMMNARMLDGDLLVIDKSTEPYDGCIAVCFLDGDFTIKRVQKKKDSLYLVAENPKFQPIEISGDSTLIVWGVVEWVIFKPK
ncbi:MAG: translesion error-prone DNA polymerase V autoproteolytic subunit [Bacteroidota bacterium]